MRPDWAIRKRMCWWKNCRMSLGLWAIGKLARKEININSSWGTALQGAKKASVVVAVSDLKGSPPLVSQGPVGLSPTIDNVAPKMCVVLGSSCCH